MPAPASDALTPLNEPLIAKVLEQITQEPDSWDQSEWAQSSEYCDTTFCFAGHAAFLNGHTTMLWSSCYDDDDTLRMASRVEVDTGEHVAIQLFAQRVLGLTYREADQLFNAPTDLTVITELLDTFRTTRRESKETQP